MGQSSSSSSSSKNVEKDWERQAAINFDKRIKAYKYAYHGPYYEYVELCRAQYELECIPAWMRHGSNYKPQYDHWGRQEY
jgi:hypothetical protein